MTHCRIMTGVEGPDVFLVNGREVAATEAGLPPIALELRDIWQHGEGLRARDDARRSLEGFTRSNAWPAERQVISSQDPNRAMLVQNLAQILAALRAFDEGRALNPAFKTIWEDRLETLAALLPSGSGIDSGVTIDRDASNGDRVVLDVPYHEMNDVGMYVGWINYRITARADLQTGVDLEIRRNNRRVSDNDPHADYLGDLFADCLKQQCRMPACLPAPEIASAPEAPAP